MSYNWNKFAQFAAIGAVSSLAVWIGTAGAKEEASVLVKKPVDEAASAQTGPVLPPLVIPNGQPAAKAEGLPLPIPPQASQPSNAAVKRPFMRPAAPRASQGFARGRRADAGAGGRRAHR